MTLYDVICYDTFMAQESSLPLLLFVYIVTNNDHAVTEPLIFNILHLFFVE